MRNFRGMGELPLELNPDMEAPASPSKRVARPGLNQVVTSGAMNLFPQVVGTTVKRALPVNERRNYLLIQNNGTQPIYLALGSNPSVNGRFLKIAANGGYWEPAAVPTNAINLISSAAGQNVVIIEGTA